MGLGQDRTQNPLPVAPMTVIDFLSDESMTPAERMAVFVREIKSRQLAMSELLGQRELIDRDMGNHLDAVRALSLAGQALAASIREVP